MANNDTRAVTLAKIKTDLMLTTSAYDTNLGAFIDACLRDLEVCGIEDPDESDVLIFNAIVLYVRANFESDNAAQAYMARYEKMKASLMMATGYGFPEDDEA